MVDAKWVIGSVTSLLALMSVRWLVGLSKFSKKVGKFHRVVQSEHFFRNVWIFGYFPIFNSRSLTGHPRFWRRIDRRLTIFIVGALNWMCVCMPGSPGWRGAPPASPAPPAAPASRSQTSPSPTRQSNNFKFEINRSI